MHIRHLIRSDDNALLLGEDSRFVDSDSKKIQLSDKPYILIAETVETEETEETV